LSYLRQLWKRRPKQWGSFTAVQRSLFENLGSQNIGIDPESCIVAIPFWERAGDYHSYGVLRGSGTPSSWQSGGAYFQEQSTTNIVTNLGTSDFTILVVGVAEVQTATTPTLIASGSIATGDWRIFGRNTNLLLERFAAYDGTHTTNNTASTIDGPIEWGVTKNDNSVSLYTDAEVAAASGERTFNLNSPNPLSLCGTLDNSSTYFRAVLSNTIILKQHITPEQYYTLSSGPSIFAPVPARTYFLPAETQPVPGPGYLRRLWKRKPKQWGSFSAVRSALFNRAELLGISSENVGVALPFWEGSGEYLYDYGRLGHRTESDKYYYNNDGVTFSDTVFYADKDPLIQPDYAEVSVVAAIELLPWLLPNYHWIANRWLNSGGAAYGMYIRVKDSPYSLYAYHNGSSESVNSTYDQLYETTSISYVYQDLNVKAYLDYKEMIDWDVASPLQYTTTSTDGTDGLMIGGQKFGGELTSSILKSLLIFSEPISADQVGILYDNPFQLWQPALQRTIFIPSGDSPDLLSLDSLTHNQAVPNLNLTQKHSVTANSLAQVHTIPNLDISGYLELLLDSLTHAQSVSNLSVSQTHGLTPDNIQQLQTLEEPALTAFADLIVQHLAHQHSLDNLAVAQLHSLVAEGLSHNHNTPNIEINQYHTVTANSLSQSQTLETTTLTELSELIVDYLVHDNNLDPAVLTQIHSLTVDQLTQAQTINNVTIELPGLLAIADLLQDQTITTADVTQAHDLIIQNAGHNHNLGTVQLILLLELAGLSHLNTLETLDLIKVITVDNLNHSNNLGEMSITQVSDLLVNDLQHNQTLKRVIIGLPSGRITILLTGKSSGVQFDSSKSDILFTEHSKSNISFIEH